jgi:hypothetical protein
MVLQCFGKSTGEPVDICPPYQGNCPAGTYVWADCEIDPPDTVCLDEPCPSVCLEGEQKCIDNDLYECIDNNWVLVEQNSSSCITNENGQFMSYFIVAGILFGILLTSRR